MPRQLELEVEQRTGHPSHRDHPAKMHAGAGAMGSSGRWRMAWLITGK